MGVQAEKARLATKYISLVGDLVEVANWFSARHPHLCTQYWHDEYVKSLPTTAEVPFKQLGTRPSQYYVLQKPPAVCTAAQLGQRGAMVTLVKAPSLVTLLVST